MRDPARIDVMLAKLGELWRKSPQLRLGQLIEHLADDVRHKVPYLAKCQTFHIEDGDMLNAITAWLEED